MMGLNKCNTQTVGSEKIRVHFFLRGALQGATFNLASSHVRL